MNVTDAAVEKAMMVRSRETVPERYALWVEVVGVDAGEYAYDLSLQPLDEAPANAHVADLLHRPGNKMLAIPSGTEQAYRVEKASTGFINAGYILHLLGELNPLIKNLGSKELIGLNAKHHYIAVFTKLFFER